MLQVKCPGGFTTSGLICDHNRKLGSPIAKVIKGRSCAIRANLRHHRAQGVHVMLLVFSQLQHQHAGATSRLRIKPAALHAAIPARTSTKTMALIFTNKRPGAVLLPQPGAARTPGIFKIKTEASAAAARKAHRAYTLPYSWGHGRG